MAEVISVGNTRSKLAHVSHTHAQGRVPTSRGDSVYSNTVWDHVRGQLLHHVLLRSLALTIRKAAGGSKSSEAKRAAGTDDLTAKIDVLLFITSIKKLQESKRGVPESRSVGLERVCIFVDGMLPVFLDKVIQGRVVAQCRGLGSGGSRVTPQEVDVSDLAADTVSGRLKGFLGRHIALDFLDNIGERRGCLL